MSWRPWLKRRGDNRRITQAEQALAETEQRAEQARQARVAAEKQAAADRRRLLPLLASGNADRVAGIIEAELRRGRPR